MKKSSGFRGRLKQSLDPVALAIVAPKQPEDFLLNELTMLATLNEAHLISLRKSKLISMNMARHLLKAISTLRNDNFSALLHKSAERGSYLLFENHLTEILGMDMAGSIHIGRSRNDINATIFKLNLRTFYKEIFNNLCSLRTTLIQQANQYMRVVMPIYSQFQVAQVGTYAHYLLAVEEALSRDQHFLKELFYSLDECPIGAGAGCGTSISIDPLLIASLLGFSRCCSNALDAVASRDLALRILSVLTIVGTTISRTAQDYQLWTTQEFSFFELPDSLCGGSSMMPQKRNPYLLEIIKGKVASLNGLLVQALTAMHNVPFSNSIEVGSQALQGMDIALKNIDRIITLFGLFIIKAKPRAPQLINSIENGIGYATGIAELLVKQKKISFREIHDDIGLKITDAITRKEDQRRELFKLLGAGFEAPDPIFWSDQNEYGGGTGKSSTRSAYQRAKRRVVKDMKWLESIEKQWNTATIKLQSSINKIIKLKR